MYILCVSVCVNSGVDRIVCIFPLKKGMSSKNERGILVPPYVCVCLCVFWHSAEFAGWTVGPTDLNFDRGTTHRCFHTCVNLKADTSDRPKLQADQPETYYMYTTLDFD